MWKRTAFAVVAVALVGLCGWALAQQGQPDPRKPAIEGGRFAVSAVGQTAVLVETTTGKTWLLHHSADGHSAAWLPAERIDDPKTAQAWLMTQQETQRDLARRRLELGQ